MLEWREPGDDFEFELGMVVITKNYRGEEEPQIIGDYSRSYEGTAAYDTGCGCCSGDIERKDVIRYAMLGGLDELVYPEPPKPEPIVETEPIKLTEFAGPFYVPGAFVTLKLGDDQ